MRPSTAAKAGAVVAAAGGFLAVLFALPRLGVWFGKAQTGLEPHATAHFVVYASDVHRAEANGVTAEAFAAGFVARWGAKHGFALPDSPVPIYLFDDHEALSKHGLHKLGETLEYNGGYFSPAERAVALVRPDAAGLRHELTHMMVALNWPAAHPSPWFAEGHAQWHEYGVEGAPSPAAVLRCREYFANGKGLPLVDLLAAPESAFTTAGNEVPYSESAALFSWLALRHPDALDRIFELERLAARATAEDFARAVGAPLPQIEAEWRAWVKGDR